LSLFDLGAADLIGGLLGFAVTLVVFSHFIGDNAVFRLVLHIFIGMSAGYIAVVVAYNVLWPKLMRPVLEAEGWELLWVGLPLFFSLLLFARLFPRYSILGSPVLAFVVGVGAAAAVGGAVVGVLFPQARATINLFDLDAIRHDQENVNLALVNGSIILVGTISSLAYFHFGVHKKAGAKTQRPDWIEWLAQVGQGFIVIAFGMIFAGIYAAALAALIERLSSITRFIYSLISGF
jgi:hypothetical protein